VQPADTRPNILEPISSRPLNPPAPDASSRSSKVSLDDPPSERKSPPTPTLPLGASKLNSFKDAKQARESAKSTHVGGGIFRASGRNTLFTPRDNGSPTLTNTPKDDSNSKTSSYFPTTSVAVLKAPTTLFDFVKSWDSLRSTEEKWQLIHTIPPTHFPALCKSSLEASMLVSILETFLAILDRDSGVKTIVQEYMESFERISRFNTLVLLLSRSEKALAKSVWIAVDIQPKGLWSGVM